MIPADACVGELAALLDEAADDATRSHWDRYLRGAASFRGTPMAAIRRVVKQLWRDYGLAGDPVDDVLAMAHEWCAQPDTEDKLAAVVLIAEHLAPRLADDHDPALAVPFERGHVADWNVCDWYATKALHAYLVCGDLAERAPRLAAWTLTPRLWQRRAGLVAFVKLAATANQLDRGFTDLVLTACANNLVGSDRFAHTGPGWVLRELSRGRPDDVARFVEAHPELSPEARRMATARLRAGPYRRR